MSLFEKYLKPWIELLLQYSSMCFSFEHFRALDVNFAHLEVREFLLIAAFDIVGSFIGWMSTVRFLFSMNEKT